METFPRGPGALAAALALTLTVPDAAAPQGAATSSAVELAHQAGALRPGEWVWAPDIAPRGPLTVYVDLSAQIATIYRNGVRIGVTTVSSGRPGYETPTGVFTILQKDADHHSTIYDNASMPFTQRLTWGGVALHAGGLPGYPESHGCVHLPLEFARLLFDATEMGGTVIVTGAAGTVLRAPVDGVLAPDAEPASAMRSEDDLDYDWNPDASPSGPVSIVLSRASRQLVVLRNGVRIGRADIEFADEDFSTHVLTYAPDAGGAPQWIYVSVPGHEGEAGRTLDAGVAERVHMPAAFRAALRGILEPGATVLVTQAPLSPDVSGPILTVMNGVDPAGG